MSTKKDVVALPTNPERAKIESLRGITRDSEGRIIRSKAWKKERIAQLTAKLEDFATRTKNAKAEIKALEAELA